MLDGHMWYPDNGPKMLIRDMPTHVIEEHLFDGCQIITNVDGVDDPIYWLRLRLDVELVRRQLGLVIRD